VDFPTFYARLRRNWLAYSVTALGFVISIAAFFMFKWNEQQRITEHAHFDASVYARMLREGAQSYVHLNRNVAGLFAASSEVTPRDFAAYIASTRMREYNPGLAYIGYLPRVAAERVAGFEQAMRKTVPGYQIRGERAAGDAAFPLQFAVPSNTAIQQVLGLDFGVIAGRRDAMRMAADRGDVTATAMLDNVYSPASKDTVFMFAPVYDRSMPTAVPDQRRAALTGYVVSMFGVGDMAESIMGSGFKQQFDLEIYDGEPRRENLLYDGDLQAHALADVTHQVAFRDTVEFAGRRWTLYFQPKAFYMERYGTSYGWLILVSGALASLAMARSTGRWLARRRGQRELADHAQRFHAVFEHHPSAVFSLDPQARIINANAQAVTQLASARDRLVGVSLLDSVAAGDRERVAVLLQQAMSGKSVRFDSAVLTDAQHRIEVSMVLMPVTSGNRVVSLLGIADNITERRQSEWRLQESRQMLQLVIDNIPQRVFWKDTQLHYLGCNRAFSMDAGLPDQQQVVGKTDHDLAWKEEAEAYRLSDRHTIESGVSRIHFEEPQHRSDGEVSWLRTSKIPLTDAQGTTVGVLGLYEDITERKRLEQRLERMALYDSLTGLPNRAHFMACLETAIARSGNDGALVGLMYFDIDKFKRINDTHGHDIGDEVIIGFGRRVSNVLRANDVMGRLGGDEFCLLVDTTNSQAMQTLAAKIVDAMQPPMRIGELALQVGTSIGIAFHTPGTAPDDMIRRADQAMYLAKQAGGNRFAVCEASLQPG